MYFVIAKVHLFARHGRFERYVRHRSHVAALLSPDAKQYELEGFDGTKSTAPAITAELQFLGKSFRGQFLLIDNWHGVLGRNVLNNLSLLFDGPSRNWKEQR